MRGRLVSVASRSGPWRISVPLTGLTCPSQPSRQNDRVEIIANDMGNRTTPSYVAFNETERLIGDAAKNQVAMNATNTVRKKSEVLVTWPFFARGGARYAPESYDAANQLLTLAPEPSLTINT